MFWYLSNLTMLYVLTVYLILGPDDRDQVQKLIYYDIGIKFFGILHVLYISS